MKRLILVLVAALALAVPASAQAHGPFLRFSEAFARIDHVNNRVEALTRWSSTCHRVSRAVIHCRETDFSTTETCRYKTVLTKHRYGFITYDAHLIGCEEGGYTPPTPSPEPSYPSPSYPSPTLPNTEGPTYPVMCADGTMSESGGHRGACSWHGGEA
jgi:hypothetical protein